MGLINYNNISADIAEIAKDLETEKKAVIAEHLNVASLAQVYLCAIDNEYSNAKLICSNELLHRGFNHYVIPDILFTSMTPSLISKLTAAKIRAIGPAAFPADFKDLYDYIIKATYLPAVGLFTAYLTAIVFGESAVANKLEQKIREIPTLKACMASLLKLAGEKGEIIEYLLELKDTLYSRKLIELLQVDLEEDIEKHDTLNPKLFENDKLKPEIKEKAIEIANELISMLEENGVTFVLSDLVITGSNASYNYTKDSDVDLHLVADIGTLKDPDGLYPILFNSIKSAFNKKFDIKFYGVPVEVYIEMSDTPVVSNGIYSVLKDSWVKVPVNKDIPEIDMSSFDKEFLPWETRYNKLIASIDEKTSEDETSIDSFIDDLYTLRTEELAKNGEYSTGNLIFKEIRNRGYLDTLKDLRDAVITNRLSLP